MKSSILVQIKAMETKSDISFILIVYYYISNYTQITLIMRQTQAQSRIVEHC